MALAFLALSAALVATPLQEAQLLAKRAEASFRSGHVQKALTQASAAYRKAPLPDILLQLGQYHRALNDWADAVANYREYLKLRPNSPDHAWVLDRIADAESHGKAGQQELSLVPLVANAPPASAPPPPPPPAPEPVLAAAPVAAPPPPPAPAVSAPPIVEVPSAAVEAPPPSHSHALAIGLGVASAVTLGLAIAGLADVVSYNGYVNNAEKNPGTVAWQSGRPGEATAWGTVAIAGAILTVAGITGTILTW